MQEMSGTFVFYHESILLWKVNSGYYVTDTFHYLTNVHVTVNYEHTLCTVHTFIILSLMYICMRRAIFMKTVPYYIILLSKVRIRHTNTYKHSNRSDTGKVANIILKTHAECAHAYKMVYYSTHRKSLSVLSPHLCTAC